MFEKTIDVLQFLFSPIHLMCISASYLPATIFLALINLQFSTLLSPSKLKYAWFARFWAREGPEMSKMTSPRVDPLMAQARGVVLDIGPGSGEWISFFDKTKVTKIYGVEPNRDHHHLLRKRIKQAGLSDVYVIVPVGVEDLGQEWVGEGSVDTVVTVQCLCSVPQPREMINALYGYVKEGGQWLVYEHVITHQGGLIALYQAAIDVVWPQFLGGCSITRDSEKWLRAAGPWRKVDLKQPELEPSYHVLPHVMGVLTK